MIVFVSKNLFFFFLVSIQIFVDKGKDLGWIFPKSEE